MKGNFKTYIQDSQYLLKQLQEGNLDHYEFVLAMILLNQTIGFKKKSDGISLSQWVQRSGLSKNKVIKTLESLKEKKFIKKKRQNTTKQGNHYSRYWLTLVPEVNKACPSDEQGLVPEVNTQVINNTSNKREKDIFSFSEETIESYIEYLLNTEDVKNKVAYSVKIKKQIRTNDIATLEALKKWLPVYKAETFYKRYKQQHMEIPITGGKILKGELSSIEWKNQRYVVRLYDRVTYKNHQIHVNQLEEIELCIKGEK